MHLPDTHKIAVSKTKKSKPVCYSLFSRNLLLSKLKLGFVVFSSPLFCIQNPGLHSVFRKLVRIGSC
ncbi:hypothetical protein ERO13_D10G065350v2 [Gossypium hirsutum]|nr:hypothetical protein ERO13_D10G065350v2 [Gossypium hirsutum]